MVRVNGSFDPYSGSPSNGTIEGMKEHRIRLTEEDLAIIVAALRARLAMARGTRRTRILELADRLDDVGRGNPRVRFGQQCEHGVGWHDFCARCSERSARASALASQQGQPITLQEMGEAARARADGSELPVGFG